MISLEILKQCSWNLAPSMPITKETRWHPYCCCHVNSFATGAVLIKFPVFVFTKNVLPHTIYWWELWQHGDYVCSKWDPLSHFGGCKWGYLVFGQKETGAKRVAMVTPLRVSFYFFCDAHLWCQVSRTLLQYFQRYCLLSISPFLVANNMTSSLI